MELSYKEIEEAVYKLSTDPIQLSPTHIIVPHTMYVEITRKQYGPYIRNGKQYWRNYHRAIKRKDAKSFFEVQYLSLPTEMLSLFSEERKEPSE